MSSLPLSYGEIAEASVITRFGSYDYAVPHNWLMQDPENRREYCWFYPDRRDRKRWGRPLSYRVLARLALRVERMKGIPDLTRWVKLWAYVHPGKALDAAGLDAVRRSLRENGYLRGHSWLLETLKVPIPSPEVMAEFKSLADAA